MEAWRKSETCRSGREGFGCSHPNPSCSASNETGERCHAPCRLSRRYLRVERRSCRRIRSEISNVTSRWRAKQTRIFSSELGETFVADDKRDAGDIAGCGKEHPSRFVQPDLLLVLDRRQACTGFKASVEGRGAHVATRASSPAWKAVAYSDLIQSNAFLIWTNRLSMLATCRITAP